MSKGWLVLFCGMLVASTVNVIACNGWPPRYTKLEQAVFDRDIATVRHLLDNKTDPDNAAGSKTPLYWALQSGQFEIAGVLLDAGANPNQKIDQNSLMERLSDDGKKESVKYVLDYMNDQGEADQGVGK